MMCFCILISGELTASAGTMRESDFGAYILTKECPPEAYKYVTALLEDFPSDVYKIGTNLYLGEPFVLLNENTDVELYYFPVIVDERVEYTYRVFYDTDWHYTLSKSLVLELNEISKTSSRTNPAIIYVNDMGNILLQNKDNYEVFIDLTEDSTISKTSYSVNNISNLEANYETLYEELVRLGEYKIVNCNSAIKCMQISQINLNADSKNSSRPYQACYRTPTILETQGSLPWCAGYVTAAIVSFKTGTNYYAQDVADFAGASTTSTITRPECAQFARSKGLSQTRVTVFDVDDEGMMDQIWNNGMVYVGAIKKGSLLSSHAFIACGYCWSGSEIINWMVRNPWYNYYEYIGSDRIYTTANGTVYKKWEYFIIDFTS